MVVKENGDNYTVILLKECTRVSQESGLASEPKDEGKTPKGQVQNGMQSGLTKGKHLFEIFEKYTSSSSQASHKMVET